MRPRRTAATVVLILLIVIGSRVGARQNALGTAAVQVNNPGSITSRENVVRQLLMNHTGARWSFISSSPR